MFWEESTNKPVTDNNSVIISFKVKIYRLPVDNIALISRLILEQLPDLTNYPNAGIHNIHGAASGNGWERDDSDNAFFYPSKRNRLLLQIPTQLAEQAKAKLTGFTGEILGEPITLSEPKINPVLKCGTILARYVASDELDESEFLAKMAHELNMLNILVKKMVCGKKHTINSGDNILQTRSLLLVDLEYSDAIRLQLIGIGVFKLLGCGLFLPHKTIEDIYQS